MGKEARGEGQSPCTTCRDTDRDYIFVGKQEVDEINCRDSLNNMDKPITNWSVEELERNLERRVLNESGYRRYISNYEVELSTTSLEERKTEIRLVIRAARALLGKNLARQAEIIEEIERREMDSELP